MKNILKFLIEAGKLKKTPRTGFVWLGIENPETIGQHIFRVAVFNWILGYEADSGLDLEEIIKISLVHDLCEVYAGDMTPYWGLLPNDPKERKKMLKRWIRLPHAQKIARDKAKFEKEKQSLIKILDNLDSRLIREMMGCWLRYEKLITEEGRFAKQGDKIETLIQALEYWGIEEDTPVIGWWEEVKELVDHPTLLNFLEEVERFFYEKKKDENNIKFILDIGKLKTMPRSGWNAYEIDNPETIAEHAYLFSLAVWSLGYNRKLDLGKALKMSLVHEFCEVYSNKKNQLSDFSQLFEGEKKAVNNYDQEKLALEKITSGLSSDLSQEIIQLWSESKKQNTLEGKFVHEVFWATTYLQALQYFNQNYSFPISNWQKSIRKYITDKVLLELIQEMENQFLKI